MPSMSDDSVLILSLEIEGLLLGLELSEDPKPSEAERIIGIGA